MLTGIWDDCNRCICRSHPFSLTHLHDDGKQSSTNTVLNNNSRNSNIDYIVCAPNEFERRDVFHDLTIECGRSGSSGERMLAAAYEGCSHLITLAYTATHARKYCNRHSPWNPSNVCIVITEWMLRREGNTHCINSRYYIVQSTALLATSIFDLLRQCDMPSIRILYVYNGRLGDLSDCVVAEEIRS